MLVTGAICLLAQMHPAVSQPAPLQPPPQDRGLPYTRSADAAALAKIRGGIAVFPGSRYGYVGGLRVRLDDKDLLRAEAVLKDGVVYVPGPFAALVGETEINPPPVPGDLAAIADRWVYTPAEMSAGKEIPRANATVGNVRTLKVRGAVYQALDDLAAKHGLVITRHLRGLIYLGKSGISFGPGEQALLDSVIALFDTPEKFADPEIATTAIPNLSRQGKWTDHVKVTPEQLAILNGPETEWTTAPEKDHDFSGFDRSILGSEVPPPGVYPRLLFTAGDVPLLAARVKATTVGRMSLTEMESLFAKSFWDPSTSDGKVFRKLATGDLTGLEWPDDVRPEQIATFTTAQQFKGQKQGIFNSHVAYVPECLTSMALYCLLAGDEEHGRQVAAAVANYYQLREPLIDEWLKLSDSEFGSSLKLPDGSLHELNAVGARTHWRNIHGLVGHMNLGLALDLAGKWMNAEEKDLMRRVIAKATYGRRSHGQDGPLRFRDVNWMSWDLSHFIAVAAIEGLPGFDAEAYASGAESARAFCDWGIDSSGILFESTGKSPGALQFQLLSMVILARRGENLFGHPHWRKLLEGSIQMTSPSGRVMVNSGTQYGPYSRQKLSRYLAAQWKTFYPEDRLADYWLTTFINEAGADPNDRNLLLPPEEFPAGGYRKLVPALKRLRLPGPTYPGMARNVLYDADVRETTRADLKLPLDFSAPFSGAFSSYSDRSPEAAWMHLYVRPNHYLGAGHHHADAGMFHFSALGVDWFTQSPFHQAYDGKLFNLVQVDGKSEAENIPGATNGYNAAAKYLGAKLGENASIASADLTDAYSWRWNTQPPQVWTPEFKAMGWELEPSAENLRIWAGTSRYKLRPWWSNYNYSNYIPTARAPFNPMKHVFRSTALIRGSHPYGVVIDDLNKDDAPHLYQWVAMLNGGVWKADVAGLAANQLALAWREADPDLQSNEAKPALAPVPGEPLLLVTALGMDASAGSGRPLIEVETAPGPPDRSGKPLYHDRLLVNRRASSVNFRMLLLPMRAGDPLPTVKCDAAAGTATVVFATQSDTLRFAIGEDRRTRLSASRGGRSLIDP
ncbi:MAG: hypothetical protein RLZZ214_3036 [Verrucomicrobiota bacterium]